MKYFIDEHGERFKLENGVTWSVLIECGWIDLKEKPSFPLTESDEHGKLIPKNAVDELMLLPIVHQEVPQGRIEYVDLRGAAAIVSRLEGKLAAFKAEVERLKGGATC